MVERKIDPFPGEPWGFDNGAFGFWTRGNRFEEDVFQRRFERGYATGNRPYLAVAPDIVGGGDMSLAFSLKWRDRLPNDWPWYLAVQDGMTGTKVVRALKRFAGLFLGGTDRFKMTAPDWVELAHGEGKPFHYARAGTAAKIRHALNCGADSLDSAFPLWTLERFDAFERMLTQADPQGRLL